MLTVQGFSLRPGYRSLYSDWTAGWTIRGSIFNRISSSPPPFSRTSMPKFRSAQLPVQWVSGASLPGAEQSGLEADWPPPSSEFKNE